MKAKYDQLVLTFSDADLDRGILIHMNRHGIQMSEQINPVDKLLVPMLPTNEIRIILHVNPKVEKPNG